MKYFKYYSEFWLCMCGWLRLYIIIWDERGIWIWHTHYPSYMGNRFLSSSMHPRNSVILSNNEYRRLTNTELLLFWKKKKGKEKLNWFNFYSEDASYEYKPKIESLNPNQHSFEALKMLKHYQVCSRKEQTLVHYYYYLG